MLLTLLQKTDIFTLWELQIVLNHCLLGKYDFFILTLFYNYPELPFDFPTIHIHGKLNKFHPLVADSFVLDYI